MKELFDLIEAINDGVVQYRDETGVTPTTLTVSPASYTRLIEIKAWEERIGNLIIGSFPLSDIETPVGKMKIVIDEVLADTVVAIA